MKDHVQSQFVPDLLRKAAQTYEERGRVYGDNYKLFGHVLAAMFPSGLTIRSVDDWNRIGIFVQVMSKVTRYANNFTKGGHEDSLLDNSVYSAMLAELDEIARGNVASRADDYDVVTGGSFRYPGKPGGKPGGKPK